MTARTFVVTILAGTILLAGCGSPDPKASLASARAYLDKREYNAAIIEIKNALAKTPEDPAARFLLARALLQSGNAVAAEAEVRKAIDYGYPADESYPLLAKALVGQGAWKRVLSDIEHAPVQGAEAKGELQAQVALAYLALDQRDRAEQTITATLAAYPTNTSARVVQVRILAASGNYPAALKAVDTLVAESPANVDALLLKSDVEASMGRESDARKTLERAIALAPDNLAARYGLVYNLVAAKLISEAVPHRDVLKKLAPGDVRALHADALVNFAQGNIPEAVTAIQKCLQLAPDYVPAVYLSGLIDLKRGALASAETSLQSVVSRSPDDLNARRVLAQTYLRRGDAAKAMTTIQPLLQRDAKDASALRVAGEAQLALGNTAKAAEFYERANAIDSNVSSQVRLAQVRMAKGDAAKGQQELEKLAATSTTDTEPDLALVNSYLSRRELDKALAAADAMIRKAPKSAAALDARGRVLLESGNLKSARASFEKALEVDPRFHGAAYGLAKVDILERNFDAARSRLEKVVAQDKNAMQARLGIAEILLQTNAPPQDVVSVLQGAIDANPTAVEPRVGLVRYQLRQRNYAAAVAAAQSANAAIADSPPIVEALGAAQQAAGDTQQALETFRRLAMLIPTSTAPLLHLADLQAATKDYAGAITSLKTAVVMAPTESTALLALATIYKQAGQADAGLADARKFQGGDAALRGAGLALEGELLAREGKLPEAAASLRSALQERRDPIVVMRLHSVLSSMGKMDEADAVLAKWLRENPQDFAIRSYIAQQKMAQKNYRAAAAMFDAALRVQPNNPTALNNMAWSLLQLNDSKGALAYGERAYLAAPMNAEVVNTYGSALVAAGRTDQGIEFLRRATDMAPSDPVKRLDLAKALLKTGNKGAARKELETIAKADAPAPRSEAEQLLKGL